MYDYDDMGFLVRIGESTDLEIPWSMLESCFDALEGPGGYDGTSFRERYPTQAEHHLCHVHVIGMMFVKAGIARAEGARYILID